MENKLEIHCCGQIFWSLWSYFLHTKISLTHQYKQLQLTNPAKFISYQEFTKRWTS